MRAAPHFVDDHERAQVVEIGLAASGRSGGADIAVYVQAGAENRRVAGAARDLPRQTARRCNAADFALRADAVAVDRPVVVLRIDPAVGNHLHRNAVVRRVAILR